VSGGVVSGITEPVIDIVTDVPVVGDVATAVGLDDAVTDLGGTVDETLGDLVGAVVETGTTVGLPPAGEVPSTPGAPGLPALPGLSDPADGASPSETPTIAHGAVTLLASASATAAAALHAAWAAASVASAAAADALYVSSAALSASGPSSSPGGLCLPSASAGPGGAGPGAWALIALVPLAAHRAWVRRAGPEDDHAPPAPAGSTDVSPD
jgi:hypothetical protein